MMTWRTALAHLLLPRYAGGTLPSALARIVRAGIAEDAGLAEAYTALRRVEHAAGDGAVTSAGQRDLLEDAIFSALPAADERDPLSVAPARRRRLAPIAPLAAAFACAALFVATGRDDSRSASTFGAGDLAARGAHIAADPLGVKVSCVLDGNVVDTATAGARRGADSFACPPDSLLAFALTNLSREQRFVFVVGVTADGSARWYAPFDRGARAFAAAPGKSNEVLPTLGDTRGMPDDAHVALHVLLSDRPFSGVDVERQLDAARARGTPVGSVERLPLADVPLQARIEMVRRR